MPKSDLLVFLGLTFGIRTASWSIRAAAAICTIACAIAQESVDEVALTSGDVELEVKLGLVQGDVTPGVVWGEPLVLSFSLHNLVAEGLAVSHAAMVASARLKAGAEGVDFDESSIPLSMPALIVPHGSDTWWDRMVVSVLRVIDETVPDDGEAQPTVEWISASAMDVQKALRTSICYNADDGEVRENCILATIVIAPELSTKMTPGEYVVRATYDTATVADDWGITPVCVVSGDLHVTVSAPQSAAEAAWVYYRSAVFWKRELNLAYAKTWLDLALGIDEYCEGGQGLLLLASIESALGNKEAAIAAYDKFLAWAPSSSDPNVPKLALPGVQLKRDQLAAELAKEKSEADS